MAPHFDCLERPLKSVFARYGRVLANYPIPFIVVPLAASIFFSFGFFYLERYADVEYLFTDVNSRVKSSIKDMEHTFGKNTSENFLKVTVVPKVQSGVAVDSDFDNGIWNKEALQEIMDLDKKIRGVKIDRDSQTLEWADVCFKPNNMDKCPQHPVFEIFNFNASGVTQFPVYFPNHMIPLPPPLASLRVFLPNFLGGVKTSQNSSIESVQAFLLLYITEGDSQNSIAWEDYIRDKLIRPAVYGSEPVTDPELQLELKHIDLTVMSTTTLDTELEALTKEALPLMIVLFSVMFTFAILVSLSTDWTVAKVSKYAM